MDAGDSHSVVASWDVARGQVEFIRSDGRRTVASLEARPAEATSQISLVVLFPTSYILGLTTVRDDAVGLLLPFKKDVEEPSAPSVYLDQLHWSSIAKLSYAPNRIKSEREAQSAQRTKELALSGSIVLPLSMAHVSETLKWDSVGSRYQHGLVMLQLSKGWQLRHPLEIRKEEIVKSITDCFGHNQFSRRSAVTLLPDAMYHLADYVDLSVPFPPEVEHQFRLHCMTAAVVLADLLLDSAPAEDMETLGWAARMQSFHDWLALQNVSKKKRNDLIDRFFLEDVQNEVAVGAALANAEKEELAEWVTGRWSEELLRCPALALFRELLREKFSNRQARWEDNDLQDLLYLSCAASYTDHVVCEGGTAGLLRQAQRRIGGKARIYRDLQQFVTEAGIDDNCRSFGL